MEKTFGIIRYVKYFPETRFNKGFTRIGNRIVSKWEYEKLCGYDSYRIVFQSDSYEDCLESEYIK